MRIPPGLSPKFVTSVNDAAAAGVATGTVRPTTASAAAAASESFRLIFIAELLCSARWYYRYARSFHGRACTARVTEREEHVLCPPPWSRPHGHRVTLSIDLDAESVNPSSRRCERPRYKVIARTGTTAPGPRLQSGFDTYT